MPLQATSGAASYDAFGGGVPAIPNYIEDVLSTWLYTGNSSANTLPNGIDLSGKGGLIWLKQRNAAVNHGLFDTIRGGRYALYSNTTNGNVDWGSNVVDFGTTGQTINNFGDYNDSGQPYVSWTFRKQPKFFDVVTYTGDGVSSRKIAHNLQSVPGFVLIKATSTTGDWSVLARYDSSGGSTSYKNLKLNTTAASTANSIVLDSAATTEFPLNLFFGAVNTNGVTYVAYFFAHNAGGFGLTGTDNVISCGSFTTDGSGNATVNLGYEPQWLMVKCAGSTGNWFLFDTMRGLTVDFTNPSATLFPNLSLQEVGNQYADINATGFAVQSMSASQAYIYIAIRRGPMKVPTDGTKVFSPNAVSVAQGTQITSGFPVDMTMPAYRLGGGFVVEDRLRGISTSPSNSTTEYYLTTSSTAAENNSVGFTYGWNNTGFLMNGGYANASDVFLSFRRAPGFFDEVCYTGDGENGRSINHNLTVEPELIIAKPRSVSGDWIVYAKNNGVAQNAQAILNGDKSFGWYSGIFPSPYASSTTFQVASSASINESGSTYVAYLFATCPGVSKVGTYTGTGTTQVINCGFTAGAKFVLIKRSNSTGDWVLWDSSRGMVAGTDPRLALNSTAAEVNANWVYTTTGGFEIVTSDATVNASGGSYIFLSIA
jgi:hypothetical protein